MYSAAVARFKAAEAKLKEAEDDAERLAAAVRRGIGQFIRYARHEMGCVEWGPSGLSEGCTCGLRATIAVARAALKAHEERTRG